MLALREIRRAKLRFSILTGAIALLTLLILFLGTITSSLVTDFIGALRNQSAPVLVFGADARRSVEGSVVLPDQAAAVGRVDGVAASEPDRRGDVHGHRGRSAARRGPVGLRAGRPRRPDHARRGAAPPRRRRGGRQPSRPRGRVRPRRHGADRAPTARGSPSSAWPATSATA